LGSAATAAAVIVLALMSGCYEELEAVDQPSPPPPAADDEPPVRQAREPTRPGLSGAKRAAQNTADKVQQRQQEIEEAIEDE
jgi:hypothetical protein